MNSPRFTPGRWLLLALALAVVAVGWWAVFVAPSTSAEKPNDLSANSPQQDAANLADEASTAAASQSAAPASSSRGEAFADADAAAPADATADKSSQNESSDGGGGGSPAMTTYATGPRAGQSVTDLPIEPPTIDLAPLLAGVDMSDPEQRARVVAQVEEAENARRAAVLAKAEALGIPVRIEKPDGGVSEIYGFRGDDPVYRTTFNADAAISTAADLIRNAPYNLDGAPVTVGVWDGGSVRATHQEFTGDRVALRNAGASLSSHATHVAGTVIAAGTSATRRGMAPAGRVDSYDWNNDISEMLEAGASSAAANDKLPISNHSYGWDTDFIVTADWGRYATQSRNVDSVAVSLPYFLQFWSAGNEQAFYTAKGGYETISHWNLAKNIVTVGAVNDAVSDGVRATNNATMTDFSSWGPTDDGRIKPDLVANGASLSSPISSGDGNYGSSSGTSMASPNAAGSAALLAELYAREFPGEWMRASTLKALLIHTADDLGTAGPDYKNGWGLVNAKAAADVILAHKANVSTSPRLIENNVTTAQKTRTHTFTWDGTSPIRATLAWTDPAGAAQTTTDSRTSNLVHNLDLTITAPDGTTVYQPYVMPYVGTWTTASMATAATTGKNNTDNVEQVYVASPTQPGEYTVTVNLDGNIVSPATSQVYSLVVTGGAATASTAEPFTMTLSNLVNGGTVDTKTYTAVFSPSSPTFANSPSAFTQVGGLGSGATAGATGYANWTGWDNQTRYFYYSITAANTHNLTITGINSNLRSSGTGPRAYAVEYATSLSGPWTLAVTSNLTNDSNTAVNATGLTISLAAGETLFVRYRNTSSVSASGGTVGSTGTGRINSTSIVGTFSAASANAPTISNFSPQAGSAGTVVTINGTNFVVGSTTVRFGALESASVTVSGPTSLRATVPANAVTSLISVTTEEGTATSLTDFVIIDGGGTATVQNATAGSPLVNRNLFGRALPAQTLRVVYTPPAAGTVEGLSVTLPAGFSGLSQPNVTVSGGGGTPSVSVSGQTATISGLAATSGNNVTINLAGLTTPDTATPITTSGNYSIGVSSRGSGGTLTPIASPPSTRVLIPIANAQNRDPANGYLPTLVGETVAVEGICSVGKLATRATSSALQDDTHGIAIDSTVVEGPQTRGNRYVAVGAITNFRGLAQIFLATTNDLIDLGPAVNPSAVTATVPEFTTVPGAFSYQSRVVRIENLTKVSGTWALNGIVTLEDANSNQLTVRIAANSTATTEPEYPATITGVAGQFGNTTAPFDTGFQLQPRDPADLQSASGPRITVAPATITTLSAVAGTAGNGLSFNLSGEELTGNLTVTAPANFQVSTTSATEGFGPTATITASGTLPGTNVWVRIASTASAGSIGPDNVTVTGGGATERTVAVSGTVTDPNAPSLSVSPTSLTGFTTPQNTPSEAETFSITAANLASDVVITPPTGFAVSTGSTAFSTTAITIPVADFVSPATISVRLTGATEGNPSGNVVVTSGDLAANVAVSGTVGPPPVVPTITVSPSSITNLEAIAGSAGTGLPFQVSGSNLTGDLTVTAPDNFEVSITSETDGFRTTEVIIASGTLDPTDVWVRINAEAKLGEVLGTVDLVSGDAEATVEVSGVVTLPVPLVVVTSPADGTVSRPGKDVTLRAEVQTTGATQTISLFEFLANDSTIASLEEPQESPAEYEFDWQPEAGVYEITGRATDADGAVGVSKIVTLIVRPAQEGEPIDDFVPPSANGAVRAVTAAAGGSFYVGGDFTELVRTNASLVVTNSFPRIARLLADGAVDEDFNPGAGPNATVRALLEVGDGLLVGGNFSEVDGEPRSGLAKLLATGELDESFDARFAANTKVNVIVPEEDGQILVGGLFTATVTTEEEQDGQPVLVTRTVQNLVRLEASTGDIDANFRPNPNGEVNAIAVQPDGKILVGGAFSQIAGSNRSRLARLHAENPNPSDPKLLLDTSFATGTGPSGPVRAVAVLGDGSVVVGGGFSSYDGFGIYGNLLKLDRSGALDPVFNFSGLSGSPATGGFNGAVSNVHARPSGGIVVSGAFTRVGNSSLLMPFDKPAGRVVQLRADGDYEDAFNPGGTGANNTVLQSATLANGNLVLVGAFTQFNGQPSSGIVVLTGEQSSGPTVSYEEWRDRWFTPAEVADPSISGPGAVNGNPSGLSNFMVYALSGGSPRETGAAIAPVGVPVPSDIDAADYFTLYSGFNPLAEAAFFVEYTDDLRGSWEVVPHETDLDEAILSGRAPDPMEAGPRQFLRLRVEPLLLGD